MIITDIIAKKRNKLELSTDEINFFIKGVTDHSIKDYQISAMLMAICINSLNKRETYDLTMAMAKSGSMLDLSEIPSIKVDKHSTGGVADAVTLALAPLTASLGLPIVKMSGKGLGHTGGTIDKLNSIPNFNTEIKIEKAIEQVKNINIVLMEQTQDLVPADKILYNLRDVTATVESIPLIASSIMSKKLASGADAIVLDVKCGSGAFIKDFDNAVKLSEIMIDIGKKAGKRTVAIITDMNQPLGNSIGNSIEVVEAIEILKGNITGKLKDIILVLGSYMLLLGNKTDNLDKAKLMLEENIINKKGLEKFRELIDAQGGNSNIIDDYSLLPCCKYKAEFISEYDGYITSIDTSKIGAACVETGAGRHKKDDKIDYGSGII